MPILSWNVHFQSLSGLLKNIVEAIRSAGPDVVTLQEVKTSLAGDVALRLADIGLVYAHWSGKKAPPPRGGNGRSILAPAGLTQWVRRQAVKRVCYSLQNRQ